MAKVERITGEKIEKLRGRVDFYLLRGITPVARRWPKKPKPPYTPLQAEDMAVFAIAQKSKRRISDNILEAWRKSAVGKRPAWGDTFTRLIMEYWKKNRSIAPIALDYEIVEEEEKFIVKWEVLRISLDPEIPEEIISIQTDLILKEDISKAPKPIYITLGDEEGKRWAAPYILYEM
ncbi:hypothetical protein ES705_16798 [subsurface metagenome]